MTKITLYFLLLITFIGNAQSPNANDDTNRTPRNTTLNVAADGVLANDSDPNGLSLSVTSFEVGGTSYAAGTTVSMTGGDFTLNSDGSYDFVPNSGFQGSAGVVTYTVSNGTQTDTATLRIRVNYRPRARNNYNVTTENTTLNVGAPGVLDNDTDADGDPLTVVRFVISGTSYNAGQTANLAEGDLRINADGSYRFSPAWGYTGTVPRARYYITDGYDSRSAYLYLRVNTPPVANDDVEVTTENTTLTGNVMSNDSDPDGNAIHVQSYTVNGTNYTAGVTAHLAEGDITINSNGSYTFVPANGYTGNVPTITYTISDWVETDSADLNIRVNNPPDTVDEHEVTTENTTLNGNVLSNDSDADGDTLTIRFFNVGGHNYAPGTTVHLSQGDITVNADGSYTFVPAHNYVGFVPDITYSVTDGYEDTTAILDIIVDYVDVTPTVSVESCNQGYTASGLYKIRYNFRVYNRSYAYNATDLQVTDDLKAVFGGGWFSHCIVEVERNWISTSDPLGGQPQMWTSTSWDVNEFDETDNTPGRQGIFNSSAVNNNELYPRQSIYGQFCVYVDPSCAGGDGVGATNGVVFDNIMEVDSSLGSSNGHIRITDFHTTETTVAGGIFVPNAHPPTNPDGTYDFDIVVTITNDGSATANNVQFFLPLYRLVTNGVPINTSVVTQLSGAAVALNGAYDGGDTSGNNTDMLAAGVTMASGSTIVLNAHFNVGPTAYTGWATFLAPNPSMTQGPADSFPASVVEDPGHDSYVIWDDAEGGHLDRYYPLWNAASSPSSEMQCDCGRTSINLNYGIQLHVDKTIVSNVQHPGNESGNRDITFQITVENDNASDVRLENLSLTDDLAAICGASKVIAVQVPTIVASSATANPIINAGFNGVADINIFDNTSGILKHGESVTVQIQVEMDDPCFGVNDVHFKGTDPAGNDVNTVTSGVEVEVYPDFDNDLLTNNIDIDDDNDAILDTDEACTGLNGYYWGAGVSVDHILDAVRNSNTALSPNATFTVTSTNFDNGSGGLGNGNNLQDLLDGDSSSLSTDPGNTPRAIIKMFGYIYLDAGTHNFRVRADDGYRIRVNNNEVAIVDTNQALTTTTHPNFNVGHNGWYPIEILYWDAGGSWGLFIEERLQGDSYHFLDTTNTLRDCDFDNDGHDNHVDLDSDNDGITDIMEAQGIDTDFDAQVDYTNPGNPRSMIDADNDGLADAFDTTQGGTAILNPDTDGDGHYDFIDIDSDGDGIVDYIEAQLSFSLIHPSLLDVDEDGLDDAYDTDDFQTFGIGGIAGTNIIPVNTDGLDTPDYIDTNSDDDFDSDALEGWDLNNDLIPDTVPSGNDNDEDGLDDAFDNLPTQPDPTNGNQTAGSFPDIDTPGGDRDWREKYPNIEVLKDDNLVYTPQNLAVGDVINYNIIIVNSGNVPLTNITVTDLNATVSGSPVATVGPYSSTVITATHTVTQADIDAGQVINSASVSTDFEGQTYTDDSDDTGSTGPDNGDDDPTITLIQKNPELTVTKDDQLNYSPQALAVGDVITYQIVVTNSGNVTLTDVDVTDGNAQLQGTTHINTLASGQSVTFTATHTVTQTDINNGSISNTATATTHYDAATIIDHSDDLDPASPGGDNDPTITFIIQNPSVEVTKDDHLPYTDQAMDVGDVVTYTIQVTNTGNVDLATVNVTDANAIIVSGNPISNLAPGTTQSVTVSHTVTQADLDQGYVSNSATATTTFNGTDYSDISDDTDPASPPGNNDATLTNLVQNPSFDVLKDDGLSYLDQNLAVGDVVSYDITVTNNGNVTLTNVVVTDANATFPGSNVINTLTVGQSETITATHTVTQADMDAGIIVNSATGTTTFEGVTITDDSDDTDPGSPAGSDDPTETHINQLPDVTIVKDDQLPYTAQNLTVGSSITYVITVTNTGNVTLNNINVTDANATIAAGGTPIASLAPGASATMNATHIVTQDEITAGQVSNSATASVVYQGDTYTDISDDTDASSPSGDDDPTITFIIQSPQLTVTKDDQLPYSPQALSIGDVITYNIYVTNSGNVDLTNITVTDANANISGSNIIASLDVNQTVTLTATHTVTQADIDAGQILNSATATVDFNGGTYSDLSDDTDPSSAGGTDDDTITFIIQTPSLVITKNDQLPYTNQNMDVGDVITYEILVTNTGNVTLPTVTVTDGNANIVSGNPASNLAPGATQTVVATHTITQADINAGQVSNSASVDADFNGTTYTDISDDTDVSSPPGDDDDTITHLAQNPSFEVLKDDGLAYSPQNLVVGDVITYTIYVHNTGNVDLTNLGVNDANATIQGTNIIPNLDVNQTVSLTAVHTVTQADIDAGEIQNSAVGTLTYNGTSMSDISDDTDPSSPVADDDPTITFIIQNPELTVTKDDQLAYTAQNLAVGDVITYQITVTNSGNVNLSNIVVTDANATLSGSPIASLAPGDSVTLTATHTVTQADINAGQASNSAVATVDYNAHSYTDISDDTDPSSPAGNDDATITHIEQLPELTVTKDDQLNYSPQNLVVGDIVTYNINVSNTGNVDLVNVTVNDVNANITGSNVINNLSPGQTVTLTATHAVTQSDIDAGHISNSATATSVYNSVTISDISDDADPSSPSGADDATITFIIQSPDLVITKNDQLPYTDQNMNVGDDITYEILVTNTGNVTLSTVTISDGNANINSGNPATNLAPGATQTIMATHTITQADLNAGQVINSATASTDFNGTTYTDDSDDTDVDSPPGDDDATITHLLQNPSFEVLKDDGLPYSPQNLVVGDVITYNIYVHNTGNVDLTNLGITDVNATIQGTNIIPNLAVNQTVTLTAVHTVTQADIDAGQISNSAVGSLTYNGVSMSDTSDDTDPSSPIANDDPTITFILQTPELIVTKDDQLPYTAQSLSVGDIITYHIEVQNVGNVNLLNINVADVNATLSGSPIASLAPGDAVTLTATHTVTQADINAGQVSNSAIATVDFNGQTYTDVSDDTDPSSPAGNNDATITHIEQSPDLTVTKDDQLNYSPQNLVVGDIVTYNINVSNTGNVDLANVTVNDANANIVGSSVISNLSAGQTVTLTATHAVTQADIDAGHISNSAIATSIYNSVTYSDISDDVDPSSPSGADDATITFIIQSPDLVITKNDQLPYTDQNMNVGDDITYEILVTNTGNVTLPTVTVSDANANINSGNPATNLVPGATQTIMATHTITQADLNAGQVSNSATASTDFNGTTYTDDSDDTDVDSPPGDDDATITHLLQNPSFEVLKDDGLPYSPQNLVVGDVVTYSIYVHNTGNVDLTNLGITDVNATIQGTNIIPNLAVNQTVTLTAVHTVTQADMDAGVIQNTAVGTLTYNGTSISDNSDDTDPSSPVGDDDPTLTFIMQSGDLTVTKDDQLAYTPQNLAVGDVITYQITVTNSGNVNLSSIVINDANAIVAGSPIATLAPGASVTLTATHTVTQADVNAGQVSNSATATVTHNSVNYSDVSDDTDPSSPSGDDDATITFIEQTPELTVTKDDQLNYSPQNLSIGDVVTYNINVSNTGNVDLSNVTVNDPNATITGSNVINTLPAGQTVTLTATHLVTQADIDAGQISNSATASVIYQSVTYSDVSDDTDPSSPAGDDDNTITFIIQSPDFVITKNDQLPYTDQNMVVGDVITYEILVTNTGNVTLPMVTVTDVNANIVSGNPAINLAPGATQTIMATHTITQADLNAGQVINSATASIDYNGTNYTDISDDTDIASPAGDDDATITHLLQNPAIEVLKDDGLAYTAQNLSVGDVITYTITVRNTGNVEISNIGITDVNATIQGTNIIPNLGINQVVSLTAVHTVTQADIDAGEVQNSAVGTFTYNGVSVSDTSDDTDPSSPIGNDDPTITHIFQKGELEVTKDDNLPLVAQNLAVGDVITYQIIVTNTGNTRLYNIDVTDANATITSGSPIALLEVGASTTVTAAHTVTQAELNAGQVSNTAVASSLLNGNMVSDQSDDTDPSSPAGDDDPTITLLVQSPALTVTKDDQLAYTAQNLVVGNIITYQILVENTGNVIINNITVTDANANISGSNVINTLAPGQVETLTATHAITQADIDAGQVINSAVASAIYHSATVSDTSDDTDLSSPNGDDDPTITFLTQSPDLVLTKNDQLPFTAQNMSVGSVITYEILVTNTGNVTLPVITVSDANATVISGNPIVNLAPGATHTVVATHTITQADLDAGQVVNSAVATVDFNGQSYSDISDDTDIDSPAGSDDPTITLLAQSPSFYVLKDDGYNYVPQNLGVGDAVTYNINVVNNGNVTLSNVLITDANASFTGSNTIPSIAVGQTVTVIATHTVTQADIDNGQISNSATGTTTYNNITITDLSDDTDAASPGGNDDPTITFLLQSPELTVTKDDQLPYIEQNLLVGTIITYQIEVTNTGNVTLINISVTDANATLASTSITSLAPGDSQTITATHTLTQADVNAGEVVNQAVVTTDYNGVAVSDMSDDTDASSPIGPDDPTITHIGQFPELTVTKDDGLAYIAQNLVVGDVITYQIIIQNTGNIQLDHVAVTDNNAIISGSNIITTLDPNQIVTMTATHTVTQADLDAGQIVNQATATVNYNGLTVTDLSDDTDLSSPTGDNDPTITFIVQTPGIVLTKDDQLTYAPHNMHVGNVITYNILVTNTGNVTFPLVSISDNNANIVSGNPIINLAPNATHTVVAQHVITQADIDAGQVSNSATASADFNGQNYSDISDDTDVDSPAGDNDPTITRFIRTPGFYMTKDDGLAYTAQNLAVGDVITYNINLVNSGNVTLTDLIIADNNATFVISNVVSVLDVGQTVTVTATHIVTQADVDNGLVINSASASTRFNYIDLTDISDDLDPAAPLGDDDPTITYIAQVPELTVTKDDQIPYPAQSLAVGYIINYVIEVTNSGNVTLENVDVTDVNATIVSGLPILSLSPGQTVTVNATHTVTQADIDAGQVVNSAVAATIYQNNSVNDISDDTDPASPMGDDDDTITSISRNPELTVTKDDGLGYAPQNISVGDIINYQIIIQNTGNVVLNSITVTDANASISGTGIINTLAPGQVETFTASHVVTQAEVDAGQVVNTAIANVLYNGVTVSDLSDDADLASPIGDDDPTITYIIQNPDLVITKNDQLPYTQQNMSVGDVITYEILVTNTGNVTLPLINVSDPNANIISGNPIVSLPSGITRTVVATHTVTQADLDAGLVVNSATASADFNGQTYSDVSDDTDIDSPAGDNDPTITRFIQAPSYYITKDDGFPYVAQNLAVGDIVTYTINVVNDGNVTLTDILIVDNNANFTSGNTISILDVNQTETLSATHVVTQADIDNGFIANTATGRTRFNYQEYTDISDDTDAAAGPSDSDATITLITQAPELTVTKDDQLSYNPQSLVVGDVIVYNITVTNSGNVTLNNISVTDANAVITVGTPIASLVPGHSSIIVATHTVTQADIDAAEVVNQAIATVDYQGNAVTDASDDTDSLSPGGPDDATITHIAQDPVLEVTKDDQLAYTPQNLVVGDVINYVIVVKNSGNVILNNIVVSDANATIAGSHIIATLVPNQVATLSATHIVTQAEINTGQVVNTAVASVLYNGVTVSDMSDDADLSSPTGIDDPTITFIAQQPSIELTKNDNLPYVPQNMTVGNIITYEILVTNTGNVTLPVVTVTDNNANIVSGNPVIDLAPGITRTVVATHTITQADLDLGYVSNSATASSDFNGQTYTDVSDDTDGNSPIGDDDPTITYLTQRPIYVIMKDDNLAYSAQNMAVGDVITYTIYVENTGNVTLTNINIDDANANIVGSDLIPILNVGQTITLSATHTVTQADIDAGEVINSATGESTFGNDTITDISDDTDPNAPAGSDDPTVTTLLQNPSFTITKDDQLPYVAQTLSVGDVITYQLVITNTGNTTLSNINIVDVNATILSGNPIASLAPGDIETLTATHTVTQADVDAGEIVNTATGSTAVNGIAVTDVSDDTDPSSPPGNDDPTVTHILKDVQITVTKDDQMSYSPQALHVGDVITYQIIVQNTGNVTLNNINVTDNNANIVGSHNIVSLDPNQIVILQAVHTVTQDDINLGQISNTATAAVQYNGTTISDLSDDTDLYAPAGDDDPTVTHLIQGPGVTVTKDDQLPYTAQNMVVGDVITYRIVVTNTGNVTLPIINVSDNNANIISGNPIVNLQPGITAVVSATHAVTQADLDAGQILNSATASFTYNGQPYSDDSDDTDAGSPSGDDDPTITNLIQNPSLVVTKDDGLSYLPQNLVVGDVITYNIVIKNDGNVTLNNIQVTDDHGTLQGNTLINQLDVNQTATYIATHTITQADIDAGFVSNTANAETTYNNNTITDDSDDLDPDSPAGNDDATITHIIQNPEITITKDDHLSYTNQNVAVGDVINYDIVVTNTGNTTLTNIQVTDNNANIITGNPIAVLDPGTSATITATHDVTQADIDAGMISNSAFGQTSFNGNNISDISDDTDPMSPGGSDDPTITHITQITGMYVTKDDQLDYAPQNISAGDVINYLIIVHNTGNVTLQNIVVTDANANIVGVNTITSIAPGDLYVLNATHIVTQDDVNNGFIINSATADTSFNGIGITDISDDTDPASPAGDNDATETHIIRTPEVTVTKDDQLPFVAQSMAVGDVITYNIVVTNTGNVTLNYTDVTDTNANIISGSPIIDLQPNLSATVIATHTITQADLDAGQVINSATAETSFNGVSYADISDDTDPDSALGDDDPTITNLEQIIEATIVKDDGLPYSEQSLVVGDVIDYEIRVTNTGNVTITHDITVTDANANIIGSNIIVGGLAVNQSVLIQATHVVTQDDIDRGYVLNQAEGSFVHGSLTITDLSDDNDTASPAGDDDPTMTFIKRTVAFNLTKDDQLTYLPQALSVGDVINYNIVFNNTGNVTLSNINVDDPNALILSGNPIATLAPGTSATITAIHTVTQADLDLGYITNTATATTTFDNVTYNDISDDTDPDSPLGQDDPTITHILKHSGLSLIKVGVIDTRHPICPMPGERIIYTFEVHNNGNQNIGNINVVDPMLTNSIDYVSGDLDGDNKIGQHEVWIYTSYIELTQAFVDAGFLDNQAIVHGIDPNGVGVSDISDDPNDMTNRDLNLDGDPDDPTHTVIPQHADLILLKEGTFNDENGNGLADVGESITYKFTVKNRCNVTIQNIRVHDPLIQVSPVSIVLEAQAVNTNTFVGVYIITLADIERGYVTNQATVEGYDPAGNLVTDLSDDPNDPTNIDPDNDGEPDDPTVIITANIKTFEILTPNDDGINEHFVIAGIESFPNNMVKIYNRWGSLVFQTSGYNNTDNYWVGLNKDKKKLPVGVYYYVIDLGIKDVENIFTGSVFLNR